MCLAYTARTAEEQASIRVFCPTFRRPRCASLIFCSLLEAIEGAGAVSDRHSHVLEHGTCILVYPFHEDWGVFSWVFPSALRAPRSQELLISKTPHQR